MLAQGRLTRCSIFGHFCKARSDFTGAIYSWCLRVVSVSFSVNSVITLPLRSAGPFTGSTKRQRGISPQEKPSFGSLKKAEV